MLAEPWTYTLLVGPSSRAAITHIIQYTKPCTAFPYFCQRTARANPRRLHQAGHKHPFLRMRLPVQICSTCCSQAQSHNLACIWSEMCNNILVPPTNRFSLHKYWRFTQPSKEPLPWQLRSVATLGSAVAWRLELPPLHPPTASGTECARVLPVIFCCPGSAFLARLVLVHLLLY